MMLPPPITTHDLAATKSRLDLGFVAGKVYITPSPMGVGLHNPQPMKQSISPLNFAKRVKLPPITVLKNHSKSQKNHNMKNPIVLD
jgi:hypothetical protein